MQRRGRGWATAAAGLGAIVLTAAGMVAAAEPSEAGTRSARSLQQGAPAALRPTVRNPGDRSGKTGDVVRLQIEASGVAGEALRFTARHLPQGLSISDAGLITGTLTRDHTDYSEVTVTDAAGSTSTVYFWWDVRGAPVVADPGDQLGSLDRISTLWLQAEDRDRELHWAVTGLPAGVTQHRPGDGFLLGYPSAVGTYRVTATATDSEGLAGTVAFTWRIVQLRPTSPPTHLTATRHGTDVAVDWSPPSEGDHTAITGYEITASPGGVAARTDAWFSSEVVLAGLDPATEHTISVVAVNAAGRSEPATVRLPATATAD